MTTRSARIPGPTPDDDRFSLASVLQRELEVYLLAHGATDRPAHHQHESLHQVDTGHDRERHARQYAHPPLPHLKPRYPGPRPRRLGRDRDAAPGPVRATDTATPPGAAVSASARRPSRLRASAVATTTITSASAVSGLIRERAVVRTSIASSASSAARLTPGSGHDRVDQMTGALDRQLGPLLDPGRGPRVQSHTRVQRSRLRK